MESIINRYFEENFDHYLVYLVIQQFILETATFKFSLQWNDEVSREQRTLNLEANDSTDLLEWMEAIGNAVVSKEAIKRQEDWWLETFGKVCTNMSILKY